MKKISFLNRIAPAAVAILSFAILAAGCESSDDSGGSYWKTEVKNSGSSTTASSSSQSSTTSSSGSKPSSSSSSSPSSSSSSSSSSGTAATEGGAADQVPFGSLRWTFGGVNGSGASKTSASIGGLSTSKSSMSYRWTGPTLASWGLSNGDAGAMACFFVMKADGTWVGGKFDWISTSRTSRGFENIFHGYSGWSLAGVPNPCPCAFVIISGDKKKRTNVIAGRWSR